MERVSGHQCGAAPHDTPTLIITLLVIAGLVGSYIPQARARTDSVANAQQHYRIIANKTSEGISPWFLLLGATSSASSLLNVFALQFHVIRCCRQWARLVFLSILRAQGPGGCLENALGILQIGLQWLCFNIVLILFIVYFPSNRKFVHLAPASSQDAAFDRAEHVNDSAFARLRNAFWPSTGYTYVVERSGSEPASSRSSSVSANEEYGTHPRLASLLLSRSSVALSPEYRLSLVVAGITAFHAISSTVVTLLLLVTLPRFSNEPSEDYPDPLPDGHEHPSVRAVRLWATFLGLLSTVLALLQYLPQIFLTARAKLVGSLSIPMMCIQSPGSFVFVYTLAVRPGVDWTTWAVYLTTGILQFVLLFMCIAWKQRQRRLGIDDYGRIKSVSDERDPLLRR